MTAGEIALDLASRIQDAWISLEGQPDLRRELRMGADGTPTTYADAVLDEVAIAWSQEEGVVLISEESGESGTGDLFAVVDPLDGTRNAGRGLPFFCTSIAILSDRWETLAAVVQNLSTHERIWATDGEVHWVRNGERVPIGPHEDLGDSNDWLVSISSHHKDRKLRKTFLERGATIRDMGSSALELAYTATGGLDAYLTTNAKLRNIDVAAGVHLIRQAGGSVTHADGEPFQLPRTVLEPIHLFATIRPSILETAYHA